MGLPFKSVQNQVCPRGSRARTDRILVYEILEYMGPDSRRLWWHFRKFYPEKPIRNRERERFGVTKHNLPSVSEQMAARFIAWARFVQGTEIIAPENSPRRRRARP